MKKITVIVPCFNEEAGIANVVEGLPDRQLKLKGYKLEVLVIDNNSTDRTAIVAEAAGARVILEPKKGKGNAVRTGFYNFSPDTDYIVMLDGDHTYDPGEVLRMVEPIDSGFCDVVVGSRLHGKMAEGSMQPLNKFGNMMFSSAARLIYGSKATDALSGYFAWSRDSLERLRPHVESAGFALEIEMITKMARLGETVYSVPISYNARAGDSNLRPFYDGSRILWMLIRNIFWRAPVQKISTIRIDV
jgi:dolichol-phosphate mannosyltransferase